MPPLDMLPDDKASPRRPRIAFKLPPKKNKDLTTSSNVALKLKLDPAEPGAAIGTKDHASLGEDQSPDVDQRLPHYDDPIGASIQRLQIPHVPDSTSDGVDTPQLTPCKSTAKRKLEELSKNPIAFVPATKATMDTEPARKRRRLMNQDMAERSHSVTHLSREYSRPDLGVAGLRNHNGAICYRRSVYQVLINTPVFVNWIKLHGVDPQHPCPPQRSKPCLHCALRNFANAYWPPGTLRRDEGAIDKALRILDKVMNAHSCVGGTPRSFSQQQDAHEFLNQLLQFLERDAVPRVIRELKALFGLKRVKSRSCTRCGLVDDTWDPIVEQGLCVNIRHPKRGLTLEEYVDNAFKEVNDGIFCTNCRTKLTHNYKHSVLDGPELMLVQMSRFTWLGGARKLHDPVPLNLYLDLSKHFKDSQLQQPGTLRYRLTGMVLHEGGAAGGHYIAKVVTPKGTEEASDADITRNLTVKDLLKARDGTFTPYILAYTRVRG